MTNNSKQIIKRFFPKNIDSYVLIDDRYHEELTFYHPKTKSLFQIYEVNTDGIDTSIQVDDYGEVDLNEDVVEVTHLSNLKFKIKADDHVISLLFLYELKQQDFKFTHENDPHDYYDIIIKFKSLGESARFQLQFQKYIHEPEPEIISTFPKLSK